METEEVEVPTAPTHPASATTAVAVRIPSRPSSTEPSRNRRSHRRRPVGAWTGRAGYAAGAVLLVAAVVLSAVSYHRLQRTNNSIAEMRKQLDRAHAQIAGARTRLAQAEKDSGAAASALVAASNQLGAIQTQLASAQANVRLDGVSIANLDACLSGVNRALNEISLGDRAGAGAVLRQFSGDCQAAEPSP